MADTLFFSTPNFSTADAVRLSGERDRAGSEERMKVTATFYSYFRDLTGVAQVTENLPEGATVGDLHDRLKVRFPKLATMRKSTLIAVGVEYQDRSYALKENDDVSLFPPVQGG
jgi:molybdopterin converting factor small subunit